mmetsp:Transcript_63514/g.127568  ORF Transcript_63514/g.127568 Transcript_63514/m.127568 type:complete len:228 (+) Transcript_63514:723-1406(+)
MARRRSVVVLEGVTSKWAKAVAAETSLPPLVFFFLAPLGFFPPGSWPVSGASPSSPSSFFARGVMISLSKSSGSSSWIIRCAILFFFFPLRASRPWGAAEFPSSLPSSSSPSPSSSPLPSSPRLPWLPDFFCFLPPPCFGCGSSNPLATANSWNLACTCASLAAIASSKYMASTAPRSTTFPCAVNLDCRKRSLLSHFIFEDPSSASLPSNSASTPFRASSSATAFA